MQPKWYGYIIGVIGLLVLFFAVAYFGVKLLEHFKLV
mgnify:CR=1 FL=1